MGWKVCLGVSSRLYVVHLNSYRPRKGKGDRQDGAHEWLGSRSRVLRDCWPKIWPYLGSLSHPRERELGNQPELPQPKDHRILGPERDMEVWRRATGFV